MDGVFARPSALTRRALLSRLGLGAAALAGLDRDDHPQGPRPRPVGPTPRARSVIYVHLEGSPPQHDLFDWKPKLVEWNGRPCPEDFLAKARFAFIKGHPKLLGSPYRFAQHGASGAWMSELLPHLAGVADRLTIVKSMHTDEFNHAPAQFLLHTGGPRIGRPSMGAWAAYGLGSENSNLPAFVVLMSGGKTPSAGKSVWGSGFLPSVYQGVQLRSQGEPVLFLEDPPILDRAGRRRTLDALHDLNAMQLERVGDPEIAARMEQYELAFRMQLAAPEAADLTAEPAKIREMYGAEPGVASFANNCLLARRLVERGVRFVQLYDWGWDTHGTNPSDDIVTQLPKKCRETDRPLAALITDLQQRGLLDETLIVWSGEFGRTAMNEERNGSKFLGRDHHPFCFTIFMAGGGTKPGVVHGETDEFGYHIVRDPVHVHDLQATILHLLGIDHERFTHRFQGRDFRLTDVAGRVVGELLA
ncbi:MAG: DUF1501 domain-containing protein [Phycisphaerales bacterium]|nr:DUF1501 domain-containing protein [Phycisphaerales bacterium]